MPLLLTQTPYSLILGNHDIQGDFNASEIMDLDMASEFSLSGKSPEGITEGSNYYVPIYD